eukprot:Selendium_serpulae@DN5824_c0_g1_i1.p1
MQVDAHMATSIPVGCDTNSTTMGQYRCKRKQLGGVPDSRVAMADVPSNPGKRFCVGSGCSNATAATFTETMSDGAKSYDGCQSTPLAAEQKFTQIYSYGMPFVPF